jgi:hypothetical protein
VGLQYLGDTLRGESLAVLNSGCQEARPGTVNWAEPVRLGRVQWRSV